MSQYEDIRVEPSNNQLYDRIMKLRVALQSMNNDEIRYCLMSMKSIFDTSSDDRFYLENVYRNDINDPHKSEKLITYLDQQQDYPNSQYENNQKYLGRKQSRADQQSEEPYYSARRQESMRSGQPSGKGGYLNQVEPSINSPRPNSAFNPLENPRRSSHSLPRSPRLTRIDLINSIHKTSLIDSQRINHPELFKQDYLSSEVTEFFVLVGFLAAIGYGIYNYGQEYELIKTNVDTIKNNLYFCLVLLAGFILIYFLLKRERKEKQKIHKLIGLNCFTEIRNFLSQRRLEFIVQDDFVKEYCDTNLTQETEFEKDILPCIKELVEEDEFVKESIMNLDGQTKYIWKLR